MKPIFTIAARAALFAGIVFAMGSYADAQRSVWVGTGPFCKAKPKDCQARGMDYVRSHKAGDGAACWSGTKVLCREKQPIPAGSKWIGKAPFCAAKPANCDDMDMTYVRSDRYGSGGYCSKGTKVLCKPKTRPKGSVWLGTAPFCAAKPKNCSDIGMIYVRSAKTGDGSSCSTGKKVLCKPNPNAPEPRKSIWLGTAPICKAKPANCQRFGLEYQTPPNKLNRAAYDRFYKDYGAHCTNGGQKVSCAIPEVPEPVITNDAVNKFNVLTFNVYAKPYITANNGQKERLCRVAPALAKYSREKNVQIDAIAFQEAFITECARGLDLYDLLSEYGWKHIAKVRGAAGGSIGNGGTFIASRWPIVAEDDFVYSDCESWDCHASKSARYARIEKTVGGATKTYNVFSTHLNAWNSETKTGATVRKKQAAELEAAIRLLKRPASEAVIIAGDLNVGKGSQEANQMFDILNATLPDVSPDGLSGTHSGGSLAQLDTASTKWLDYVLYSAAHLKPSSAKMTSLALTVPKFSECTLSQAECLTRMTPSNTYRVLSDHMPVLAEFSFSNEQSTGSVGACPVNAKALSGVNTCTCPAIGTGTSVRSGIVWGSGPYTHDSSICTAARHAGVLPTTGGHVTLRMKGRKASFTGSSKNGVTTKSYRAWPESFDFE